MRRVPRLPHLRAGSSLLALVLLAATPAAPRQPFTASRVTAAPPQEAEAATRSGVLKALIVLKIAPYLTPEPPPRAEHGKQKPREPDGKRGTHHAEPKDNEPPRSADGAGAPRKREYRIALVGDDDASRAAAQMLVGKCVGEAKVKVVAVKPEHAADPEAAAEYELIYVAASVDANLCKRIVAANEARAIPVVSARPSFAADGGGVQLFVQDNVVKFEINADALRRQGLRVDSQLLKLSKKGPQ